MAAAFEVDENLADRGGAKRMPATGSSEGWKFRLYHLLDRESCPCFCAQNAVEDFGKMLLVEAGSRWSKGAEHDGGATDVNHAGKKKKKKKKAQLCFDCSSFIEEKTRDQ